MGQADYMKKWKEKNKEKVYWYSKNHRLANREYAIAATRKSYYKHHEKRLEAERQRYRRNKALFNAKVALRKAVKLRATPAWANKEYMNSMYVISRLVTEATGVKHHVDHIVPLMSDIVCGLHVPENLQVISGSTNLSKSNRYWPNMPE